MKLARTIIYLLCGILLAQIIYYYPNLPETVASHFNASGNSNGWMSKQSFVVFEGVILLIIILEFTLLPFIIRKMPDKMVNLPNKEYWLAAERREAAFDSIKNFFEWFSAALLGLFLAVNQLVFEANLKSENLPATTTWLIIGAFIVFTIVWLIKFIRRFRVQNI